MATDWDKVGGISSITGTVQGMIGSYYAAETENLNINQWLLVMSIKKIWLKLIAVC